MRLLKSLVLLSLILVSNAVAGKVNTSNYWKCYHRVGGSWDFGRVPSACDISAFGDASYVYAQFGPIIFNDNNPRTAEKKKYINNQFALIRDAARDYLSMRKPSSSQRERDEWGRAVLAITHQETFMTHYRTATDNRLKMIRGDYGHGHGMMQVDDRWHFTEINEGKGWQIFDNITYALEIFYAGWQKAQTASCVPSSTSWRSRSRAAYSVYNGGSSKVCRWTNPNDTWARNDKHFKEKYDAKGWEPYVSDLNAPSILNTQCYMLGNEYCANVDADDEANWENRLLKLPNANICLFKDEAFTCVEQEKDAPCLSQKLSIQTDSSMLQLSTQAASRYPITLHERTLCQEEIRDLYTIAQSFRPVLDINLRSTPGGALIGKVSQTKVYQVLDFEVRDAQLHKRYYKVKEGDLYGYIYAGKLSDVAAWTTAVEHSELEDLVIAMTGDSIRIVPQSGINLRDDLGELLGHVPYDSVKEILAIKVTSSSNNIYYKVSQDNTLGWIYAGRLLPDSSLPSWTTLDSRANITPDPSDPDTQEPTDPQTPPASRETQAGDTVSIIPVSGINLRDINGVLLANVPQNTRIEILDIRVEGSNEQIYYKVSFNAQVGWIYAGYRLPQSTLENWTQRVSEGAIDDTEGSNGGVDSPVTPTNDQFALEENLWWTNLHSCKNRSCKTQDYLFGPKLESFCLARTCDYIAGSFSIVKSEDIWTQIKLNDSEKIGWIKTKLIKKNN